jgi:hypothetical protein
MNRGSRQKSSARRGAARAEREREALRISRYAQRLEREGRTPVAAQGEPPAATPNAPIYEMEVVPGLEEFARAELHGLVRARAAIRPGPQQGTLRFPYRGEARALLALGTVTAVYRVHCFDVPRPRALLGEEHLQTLFKLIGSVRALQPAGAFQSFRFGAAGVTSSVFTRLAEVLQQRTGLRAEPEEGDLLIRVRPAAAPLGRSGESGASGSAAFEVLIRLTPRPLAAREWRVCNFPGALNATVARAMVQLTNPAVHDRFLNLTCGSGTLMVERLALGPARLVLGGDRDPEALRCAWSNLVAAGCARGASLARWEAGRLPLADASVSVLCADLPYGMLMGTRRENERLYPELLAEATRVAGRNAAMVLITHAVSLLDRSLARHRSDWQVERRFDVQLPFKSGMLKPQVFLLRRTRYSN